MQSRRILPRRLGASLFFSLAAGLLLSLTGCHPVIKDPDDPRFIAAEKPGAWSITRKELNDEVDLLMRQQHHTRADFGPSKMPLVESQVLRGMVLKKLILARAAALNIQPADVDKDANALLDQVKSQAPSPQDFDAKLKEAGVTMDEFKERIHDDIVIRKVLEAEALKDDQPTDQDVDDFYMKNKDKFIVPDKVRASRVVIMVDDRTSPAEKAAKKKTIDSARARVVKGEDFGKVASEISEDRYSAPKGGDIGYFQKGENEENFDAIAFSTKPGVISPVFETPMGYQFLKVTDVQPGGVLSVAQVRDVIAQHLREAKESQQGNDYTKNLLDKSGVIFHLVQPNLQPAAPLTAPADANAAPAPGGDGSQMPAPAPATNQ
jgi:parvulin-like peptidyl-prolyl isomerase